MEPITEMAEKLKLLGDKSRLTMLALLRKREFCVCEFVEILNMSQPGISQHLRKLKSQGIVNESRRGQWVYYSLNVEDKPYIKAVLDAMPEIGTLLPTLDTNNLSKICDSSIGGTSQIWK